MSTCSSAASERSVVYDGIEMSVEALLEQLIRTIQGGLNNLQQNLRELCALEDQAVDDDADFREAVELSDATEDLVDVLIHHLSELPPVVHDLRGSAPPGMRDWFKDHQAQRRIAATAEKARLREEARAAKADIAAEKVAAKLAASTAKLSTR
jgi:hypothetical protein